MQRSREQQFQRKLNEVHVQRAAGQETQKKEKERGREGKERKERERERIGGRVTGRKRENLKERLLIWFLIALEFLVFILP